MRQLGRIMRLHLKGLPAHGIVRAAGAARSTIEDALKRNQTRCDSKTYLAVADDGTNAGRCLGADRLAYDGAQSFGFHTPARARHARQGRAVPPCAAAKLAPVMLSGLPKEIPVRSAVR